jgi:hypothetical protein
MVGFNAALINVGEQRREKELANQHGPESVHHTLRRAMAGGNRRVVGHQPNAMHHVVGGHQRDVTRDRGQYEFLHGIHLTILDNPAGWNRWKSDPKATRMPSQRQRSTGNSNHEENCRRKNCYLQKRLGPFKIPTDRSKR